MPLILTLRHGLTLRPGLTLRRGLALLAATLLVATLLPEPAQATAPQASDAPLVPVIVQLEDAPLASYRGGVPGLAPTSPEATGQRRVDPTSADSRRYLAHLDGRFDRFERELGSRVPRAAVTRRFDIVLGGVAAQVPVDRIGVLRRMPGVTAVTLDEPRPLDSDRGPAFVGAPAAWTDLGGQDDAGEGVIVGVIDTGIWPEHPSFSDPDPSGEPYPTPPGGSRACDFGSSDPDDPDFTCNDKLIGAYRFMDTWESAESHGPHLNTGGFRSARDNDGHGTHTASTAVGNGEVDAVMNGRTVGTVSGIAPRAHVIAYKVCGTNSDGNGGCYPSDSVDAVQQAVADGVDVINFSISGGSDPYGDPVEQAFQDAYAAGIVVAASAGNSGPEINTVAHRGPWTLTVGASTHDRWFSSTITLQASGSTDRLMLTGASITDGISTATPVVDAADHGNALCEEGDWPAGTFSGEIVACKRGSTARVSKSAAVAAAGGGGMLLYNVSGGDTGTNADLHAVPSIHLEVAEGQALTSFLDSHSGVTGTFPAGSGSLTRPGDVMASFSSRGGSGQSLGVSKPDVTAPGVDILAGYTPAPNHSFHTPGEEFAFVSGTSMSSPATAGAAALVVDQHPGWTPGQVRSALMTTATDAVTNHTGGSTTAFDRGTGRIDLTRAGDPGLTFDESAADYDTLQSRLWDSNHPSLYHPSAGGTLRVQRTVRSHLSSASTWTTSVIEPAGVKLEVPASIEVAAGGTATFEIAANVRDLADGTVRHTRLELTDGTGRVVAFPIVLVKGTDPANSAPVASSASVSTEIGIPLGVTLEATDANDDLLDYAVTSPPAHGTLSGTAPDLTYTPDTGYAGPDSFDFVADDGDATSNTATVSISVADGDADLSVTLSDSPDPVAVGDPVTYTSTVSNGGPDDATGLTLTLDLPSQVSSPVVNSGPCTVSTTSPEITCDIGSLAVGPTATVEVAATATSRTTGALATADATSEQLDPTDNTVTTTTRIAEPPDAPTDVSAAPGDQQATVIWAAPADSGGSAITSYTVTSSPGGNTEVVGGSARSATLTGLTNGTSYTFDVTATNAVGTGPAGTSNAVTPAEVPGAPGDVSATAGDQQATVSWSAPVDDGGSAITSYTVTSSPGGNTEVVGGSARSATVPGLTNGTSYTFDVTATNAVGTGPEATSNAVTPAGLPGPPGDVSATADDQQATVAWSAADPNGSTITSYTVTSSPGGNTVTVAGTARSATFTGLTNGTSYTFDVTATNAVGTGPAATSNAVTPGQLPGAPTDVSAAPGDQQATVDWSAPADDGGSTITSYTVTSSPGGETVTVDGSERSATVPGLTNGTSYTFTVTATNLVGAGPGATSNAVTPAGLPGAPPDVSATAGDRQATVAWSAAAPNGSTITSYTVTSSPGGKTTTVAGSARSATVPGLTNGASYRFKVTATNVIGTGPAATSNQVVPGVRLDGDPSSTERVDHGDPIAAAVEMSRSRFAPDAAGHVVLSRVDTFADSLAGAALTDRGPLLLTTTGQLASATRQEIDRVLRGGGTVYVLGGTAAVGQGVEDELSSAGYAVRRLFGPSRLETALAVADQVRRLHPSEDRVALARAYGTADNPTAAWADSITGGAWAAEAGVPIVLSTTEALSGPTARWLADVRPSQTILLGGRAALSDAVETAVQDAVTSSRRVAGPARDFTAVAIARDLWGATMTDRRDFLVIEGFRTDGWAFGLAAAGLASDLDAPLLVVEPDGVPAATEDAVSHCGSPTVDLLLVGSTRVISDAVAGRLDQLDGGAC